MKNLNEYFRNINENPSIKELNSFNNTFEKLYYEELFPCYFVGDIYTQKDFVTISLNPKLDSVPNKQLEQGNDLFKWFNYCRNAFTNYKNQKSIHSIFKNLAKIFFSPEERINTDLRTLLQDNVINLDWCPYYSSNFPTLTIKELTESERKPLYDSFNKNIEFLLEKAKPKVIFIHGKSFESWVAVNCKDMKLMKTLQHGDKPYKIFKGTYLNTNIPIVYQEWFINRANGDSNLEEVYSIIKNCI